MGHHLSITPVPEFAQRPAAKHQSDACCSLSLWEGQGEGEIFGRTRKVWHFPGTPQQCAAQTLTGFPVAADLFAAKIIS